MMYITFEISRPIQIKPRVMWLPNVRLFIVEWLLFAFHFNPSYTPSQLVAAARAATRCEMSADVEAAQARIAKLEARLADQEWRPVTEDAPTYMIVDLLVTGYNTEDGYRVGPDNTDVIKAWRPSQPESAATE